MCRVGCAHDPAASPLLLFVVITMELFVMESRLLLEKERRVVADDHGSSAPNIDTPSATLTMVLRSNRRTDASDNEIPAGGGTWASKWQGPADCVLTLNRFPTTSTTLPSRKSNAMGDGS